MQLRFWQAQAGKELLYQGTLGPGHFALSPSGACAIRSGDERVLEAPGVGPAPDVPMEGECGLEAPRFGRGMEGAGIRVK